MPSMSRGLVALLMVLTLLVQAVTPASSEAAGADSSHCNTASAASTDGVSVATGESAGCAHCAAMLASDCLAHCAEAIVDAGVRVPASGLSSDDHRLQVVLPVSTRFAIPPTPPPIG